MRNLFVFLFSIFFAGCSGIHVLGQHELMDGRTIESVQFTSKSEAGPKIRTIENWLYTPGPDGTPGTSTLSKSYTASGQGIVDAFISTSIPAVVTGGFGVAAARARRPNKTTVTQSGGGAGVSSTVVGGDTTSTVVGITTSTSSSEGGSGGEGGEGGEGGTGGTGGEGGSGGHGCPGNSCGQGGNGR